MIKTQTICICYSSSYKQLKTLTQTSKSVYKKMHIVAIHKNFLLIEVPNQHGSATSLLIHPLDLTNQVQHRHCLFLQPLNPKRDSWVAEELRTWTSTKLTCAIFKTFFKNQNVSCSDPLKFCPNWYISLTWTPKATFTKYFGHIMCGFDFMAKSIFENFVKNVKNG